MSQNCHIIIKFKIKNPIIAGIPNVVLPIIVYSFTGIITPVNFFVKLIIQIIKIPLKAFRNKNLKGFRLLIDKINIYKYVIPRRIKTAYFKKIIIITHIKDMNFLK